MPSSTAMVLNSLRIAAGGLDLACDQLAHVLQMHMAGHELRERVGHCDDRLVEITILHAGGTPQHACAGRGRALGDFCRTVLAHVFAPMKSCAGRRAGDQSSIVYPEGIAVPLRSSITAHCHWRRLDAVRDTPPRFVARRLRRRAGRAHWRSLNWRAS
jgi:hypothetical protein